MKGKSILVVVTYLCFVAELAFIIIGESDYAILFAGLCFCLVILFFVLWREEQAHKRLILQGRLEDALLRERMENAKTDRGRTERLRREKEELACGREEAERQIKALTQEKETLEQQFKAAEDRRRKACRQAAECLLPPDEKPTDMDLAAVAAGVVAQMEEGCRKAGIRLSLSCAKEQFPYRADERYIRLILHHIIENAVKYMRRSGRLVITLSHLGDYVFWAFKDNGMGLPQEETEHIFDLNFQGSNRSGGNGLGLAQVKAVISHYGGTVYARGTEGMGIYIQLPLSRKAKEGGGGTQEEKAGETAGERNATDEDTAGGGG